MGTGEQLMENERRTYRNPVWEGADPFVLLHEGVYYLYATTSDEGYRVFTSDNLADWTDGGFCLRREDVMGNKWFWAPEVICHNGKFYMAYSSEEHLGIAVADSPLGPFRQENKRWLSERNAIDGHFFRDDDGQVYLFYVRFDHGNVIYCTKMKDDMLSFDEEHEVRLIEAAEPWETHLARVAEGPFVLKHGGKYYLTYSANDYQSPHYAIGYAVADSPMGSYRKYEKNPILSRSEMVNGVGHHSFTTSRDGEHLVIVYHCHQSLTEIHPRMTCMDRAAFVPAEDGGIDVLTVDGPTSEDRALIC